MAAEMQARETAKLKASCASFSVMPVSHNACILVSRCFSSFCHPAKIAIAILRSSGSLRISDGLRVIKAAGREAKYQRVWTIMHEITAGGALLIGKRRDLHITPPAP
jgi:hypothetical protein